MGVLAYLPKWNECSEISEPSVDTIQSPKVWARQEWQPLRASNQMHFQVWKYSTHGTGQYNERGYFKQLRMITASIILQIVEFLTSETKKRYNFYQKSYSICVVFSLILYFLSDPLISA